MADQSSEATEPTTLGDQLAAEYRAAIDQARADLAAAGKPSHRSAAVQLARSRLTAKWRADHPA